MDSASTKTKRAVSAKQREHLARITKNRQASFARGEIKLGRPKSLRTLKREEDKKAREKFLLFASANVLPIGDALVQRAKQGDVQAIKEFFDRTWGKAPQSFEHKVEHIFSLAELSNKRGIIDGNPDTTLLGVPQLPAPHEEQ